MFKCGLCNTKTKHGEKATRVVTERRVKVYPFRQDVYQFVNEEGEKMINSDPGGKGWEIVKEVLACEACVPKSAEEVA